LPIIETTIPLGNDFKPGQSYRIMVNDKVTNTFLARDREGMALAPIEAVEVLILESFPLQYKWSSRLDCPGELLLVDSTPP
jgi:hypothetical protein